MPLEAINAEAAREKSIRHGHPSTLHLWWARRPLAACRAVIFCQLVDDPSSVPEEFPTENEQQRERERLHTLIADLAQWENSRNSNIIASAQREIARSISRWRLDSGRAEDIDTLILNGESSQEQIASFLLEKAPPLHDPFCGGGSIPLEAQRLGLKVTASDLNPVAVLITKAMIELPHRFSGAWPVNPESGGSSGLKLWDGLRGLTEDIRYYGRWMHMAAEKRIGHLYPKVHITEELARGRQDLKRYLGRELPTVAWLWARNVRCPSPACAALAVLIKSLWLSHKKGKKTWLEPIQRGESIRFNVAIGEGSPQDGTVNRRSARCLCCGSPIPLEYVRSEGRAGRLGQQLIAIVAEGSRERLYLPALPEHEKVAKIPAPESAPETYLPDRALGFRVQAYGMKRHRDLFTDRQLLTLSTLTELIEEVLRKVETDAKAAGRRDDGQGLEQGGSGGRAYAELVATYLALTLSKVADRGCSLSTWMPQRDSMHHAFARHALAMVWDFVEVNTLGDQTGGLLQSVAWTCESLEMLGTGTGGKCFQADAKAIDLPQDSVIIATDPPYYDNIGYSDLSDFFYVWLRKSLAGIFPSIMGTVLTPKDDELIATEHRTRSSAKNPKLFFEEGFRGAFELIAKAGVREIPVTVYYAFKQAEDDEGSASSVSTGWDTMLSGLMAAGFTVASTWPIRTERTARAIEIGSNALASSITLACRKRLQDSPLATRSQFIADLKAEMPAAIKRLQQTSIAPVDLAQSSIGPGMAIFTRYSIVLEADGSPMSIRTALGQINRSLDEALAAEEVEYDSDTRWAITWFSQYGFEQALYGVAETLSKARNTSVQGLERAGIVEARAGKVRLLKRDELGAWHPTTDDRFTIWEACQHLIKTLELDGEAAAARLLKQLDSRADAARDLAYRLYQHCDRKGDAEEARAYNGLVVAWPRLAALAAEEPRPVAPTLDFT